VLATFLVLAISFDSSPIQPSVPKVTRPAPDPRAIALVDELTGRSAGRGRAAEPRVVRPADLDSALAGRPQHSFDLFAGGDAGGVGERRAEFEVVRKFPFGRAIARAAERQRVDPLLLAAIVETESAFAPDAVSTEGAIGLMQLIPETGELYGKTDLFDPYVNLEVGSRYIGALLERYHGDLALALAAYNCGPATVTRYGSVPPFAETRDFVKSVLALYVDHRQSVWKRSRESTDLLSSSAGATAEWSRRGRGRATVLGTPAISPISPTSASRNSFLLAR
jgi:hypothetical protein